MTQPRHRIPSSTTPVRSTGFTLIELLVVIGIITLLISILLPVAGRVRVQAQSAKTQSTMSAISGAIERYFLDHKSYPGVVPNVKITAGFPAVAGNLTSSENLVLTLVGGFKYLSPDPTIDLNDVGKGPLNLSDSTVRRTRGAAYLDAAPGGMLAQKPWDVSEVTGMVNGSTNPLEMVGPPVGTPDSSVPEFLDDYSQRRAVLYLRANVGGTTLTAVATSATPAYDADTKQYNQNHLLQYARGATPDNSFVGDFTFPNNVSDPDKYASWSTYLSHPNAINTPRGKDKYILISAGPDRTYGTRDDIFVGG